MSALTAILWSADMLILFSDIDGVYSDNPKTNPNAKLIESVESIPELRKSIKMGDTNAFGTGGMETKIQAAEKVNEYGIQMLLANGGKQKALISLLDEDSKGTLFKTE